MRTAAIRHLADVQFLKAEYGISSDDALRYLKITEEYESLRRAVIADLRREGVRYEPSLREVANVCSDAAKALGRHIEGTGAIMSDFLGQGFGVAGHGIYPARQTQMFRGEQEMMERLEHQWTFDYTRFLAAYCRERAANQEHLYAFQETIDAVLDGDDAYFRDALGDPLRAQDIIGNERYLVVPVKPEERAEREAWEERMFSSEGILGSEGRIAAFLDLMWHEDIDEKRGPARSAKKTTQEERHLLYGLKWDHNELYLRAEREHTLGRLEVERRIALAAVADAKSKERPSPEASEAERIAFVLRSADQTYRRLQGSLRIAAHAMGRERIMDWRLSRNRYVHRAVLENREWLERVLSR